MPRPIMSGMIDGGILFRGSVTIQTTIKRIAVAVTLSMNAKLILKPYFNMILQQKIHIYSYSI